MENIDKIYFGKLRGMNDGFVMTVFLNRRDFNAHEHQIKIDKFEV